MANNYDITQKLQAIADAITQGGGGGGGGTTVIANPSGTPTDTLNTIQIGSTIYDIAGSGGGGGVTSNILYTGNAYASIINLNYDLFNYDLINVLVSDSNGYTRGFAFAPSELLSGQTIGFDNTYGHVWYVITSGTVLTASARQNFFIKDIVGFRTSSGALPELISEDFDPTLAYTIGEYCIYDNTLYKFTSAKSAGSWDNTKVSDTTVGEELTLLNSNIAKNDIDSNVDLSSYTSLANAYVAPTDGYINFGLASNSTLAALTIFVVSASANSNALDTTNARPSSGWNNVTLFVKKGMRIYCGTVPDSRAFANFRKLI